MFQDTCNSLTATAKNKEKLFDTHPAGYFVSSMMAGMFVALGGIVAFSMSALGAASPLIAVVRALLFSVALMLVTMGGSELFTGNNMTLGMASLQKSIKWQKTGLIWLVCWLGNFVGAWVTVALFHLSGAGASQAIATEFTRIAAAKIAYTPVQLICRGVFCNVCVCLACWCAARMKEETAKLIITMFCIMIMMICGFEHSVANMSLIGIGLINSVGEYVVTVGGYFYNLFFVTIGNIIGGAFCIALPYWFISK